jgi:hypothetical protein
MSVDEILAAFASRSTSAGSCTATRSASDGISTFCIASGDTEGIWGPSDLPVLSQWVGEARMVIAKRRGKVISTDQ